MAEWSAAECSETSGTAAGGSGSRRCRTRVPVLELRRTGADPKAMCRALRRIEELLDE